MEFIGFLLIGIFAGWLAEQIMGRNHGLITNLIVGLVGAFIGGTLARTLELNIGANETVEQLVLATVGAIILLGLLSLLGGRRESRL